MKSVFYKLLGFIVVTAAVLLLGTAAVSAHGAEGSGSFSELDEGTIKIINESRLPVVSIESKVRADKVGRESTEVLFKVWMPEIVRNDDDGATVTWSSDQLYDGAAEIHLRGNSTSGLKKKPYKVKLEKKADLLGMGKSKHWVLLANAIDLTNMRNALIQSVAADLGLNSMDSRLVSLIYNGEYMGVYELSEQVRVGKSRVNVYDWDEIEDGEIPPAATGGVLMEMDFYSARNADLMTSYHLPIYINTPEPDNEYYVALRDYMKEYIQSFEYALHSTDFVFRNDSRFYKVVQEGYYDWRSERRLGDTYAFVNFDAEKYDGWHYTDFLDINSAINNMLICELSVNWDSMKNSFFMYKDVDSPLVFGPTWDFDWAWGNSLYDIDTAGYRDEKFKYAHMWQTTNEWFANEQYYQTQQFNRLLIRDPYFVVKLYERYHERKEELFDTLLERYDSMAEATSAATKYNYERWKGTDSCGGSAGTTSGSQLRYTRYFLKQRLEWLEEQFADIDTLMESLGYYAGSDAIEMVKIDTGESREEQKGSPLSFFSRKKEEPERGTIIGATVALQNAVKLSFQVNGKFFYEADVVDGYAEVTIPDEALAGEEGRLSVVQVRALDEKGSYIRNIDGTIKGVYNNAVSAYTVFRKEIVEEAVGADKKMEIIAILTMVVTAIVMVLAAATVITAVVLVIRAAVKRAGRKNSGRENSGRENSGRKDSGV